MTSQTLEKFAHAMVLKDQEVAALKAENERLRNPDRERLAALCHEQWSGWMKYLFEKVEGRSIPEWAWIRWTRQMNTSYVDLPESEKDSDRAEADRIIGALSESPKEGGA